MPIVYWLFDYGSVRHTLAFSSANAHTGLPVTGSYNRNTWNDLYRLLKVTTIGADGKIKLPICALHICTVSDINGKW